MLKEIISITGKPGLYKIVSQGRGTLIVEKLDDKHRMPVHARDQVVALGNISMYTENGDTPLGEILDKVYAAQQGKAVDYKSLDGQALRSLFGGIIEDYDKDRVRDSDIRKLFQWYNILVGAGLSEFAEKEEPKEEAKKEEEK